ncbi:MAG: SUMF1/EgtB/PvdO family nonheme iron enzyme [Acidobacteria bacterium]|nr:SUMF1/EgtB/PvdO family nonheme iron enzyme [Acidobacteriota bacterium]
MGKSSFFAWVVLGVVVVGSCPSPASPGRESPAPELPPVVAPHTHRGVHPGPFPERAPATVAFAPSDAGSWDGGFAWNAFCNVSVVVVSGTEIFVGGDFSALGGLTVNGIAKWDGSTWTALGSGFNGSVRAIAVSGGTVYAGGDFTTAGDITVNRVAKWDGTSWSALANGVTGRVNALAVSGNDLYVGGEFIQAGYVAAHHVAKWNGTAWSTLKSGLGSDVYALAVSGGDLYAGGDFTSSSWTSVNHIAKWDGSSWSALGKGANKSVRALAVSGGDLYAGGLFTTAGGSGASRVAKWDGSAWSPLGAGLDGDVTAIAVIGSDVFAGGTFHTAGGADARYIAKWDGGAWSPLGTGMNAPVWTLTAGGGSLYAGGLFSLAGGVGVESLTRYDGTTFHPMGPENTGQGVNSTVYAVVTDGTDVYAGGRFTRAGGVIAGGVARWDGSAWSALGEGVDGTVYAIAVVGTTVYVGGDFTRAGGIEANRVAKWDGSAWSPLGSGVNDTVLALAVSGGDLFVGGWFTEAGGAGANHVARWDGAAWSALGSGTNNSVKTVVAGGGAVYVGGYFSQAGGVPASRIAKWDGTAWSALGGGVDNGVEALAVNGSDVYAGGFFVAAGGKITTAVAKWNGSAWSALGTGIVGRVRALAWSAKGLYVGGTVQKAGGIAVNRIANWDGNSWTLLREGVNHDVEALAAKGYDLFVGGWFIRAGSADSGHLALWRSCPEPDAPVITSPPAGKTILQGQTASLTVTVSGAEPLHYQWYQGISLDTRVPAPGAMDAPVYTTPVLTADASYWVRVSSACGVTDSPPATVTVRYGLYAAHAAHSDLWWTRVNLLNAGAANHPVNLKLYDAEGALLETRILASLPAGSLFAADLASLFSPAALSPDMWLTADSLSPLQGVLEFGTRDSLAYVAMPMETAGFIDLIFPYVVVMGEWYTGITLVNIGDAPAQLRLDAYREDGGHIGTVDGVLASGAKYVRLVNQVFPAVSDPTQIRFVKVTSTQPLVAFELFGNMVNPGLAGLTAFDGRPAAASQADSPGTGSGESLPGTIPAADHELFFNEIPDNALFYTGVTFSNLGADGVPASVKLLNASGDPVAQGEIYLPPNAQVTREIWDVFDGVPRPDAVSLHATAAAPLAGFELYLSRSGGNIFRFDGIGASSKGSRNLLFPLVKRGSAWTSNLRVLNVTAEPVTVKVRGYDPTGESAGLYTVSLTPGARLDSTPEAMLPSPFYEVAWLSVEGTGELAGDLFMVSTDLTRLGSYRGIPVARYAAGDLLETDALVGNLRFVPAKKYAVQGSPVGEPCRNSYMETQFTHTLTRSLAVMETEVTRKMWADLKSVQPSLPDDPSDVQRSPGMSNPVQTVTWYAAVLFANLLSVERGLTRCYYADAAFTSPITSLNYETDAVFCHWEANGYRLPTEGEWEYFCRAGTTGPFCVDEPNYIVGNCDNLSPNPSLTSLSTVAWWCGNTQGTTSPVGLKEPNAWNIKDLHGNVYEWCWDWLAVYPVEWAEDYRGPSSGLSRATRSGCYSNTAKECRSANRHVASPNTRSSAFGFRLVRGQ